MPKRTRLMMLVASILSGLVVWFGIHRLNVMQQQAKARQVPVVLAVVNLARGTILNASHVELQPREPEVIPAGALTNLQGALGRIVRKPVSAGAPLLEESLGPVAATPFLTMLPEGMRAMAVFVDPRGNIHEFLRAGDRVDVVVTVQDEQDESRSAARVLLQNIEVLSVPVTRDDTSFRSGGGAGSQVGVPVVLGVTPADAEKLSLAMGLGTIQLAVRGYEDESAAATSGVTGDMLLPSGAGQPAESRAGAADKAGALTYRTVEVIKGRDRSTQRFQGGRLLEPVPAPTARTAPKTFESGGAQ